MSDPDSRLAGIAAASAILLAILLLIALLAAAAFAPEAHAAMDSVTVHLPAYEDWSAQCGDTLLVHVPCTDLGTLVMYGWRSDCCERLGDEHVVATFNVRGLEGQRVRAAFPESVGVWEIRFATRDTVGNESCKSAMLRIDERPLYRQLLATTRAWQEFQRALRVVMGGER
jgi:hypothetical protein